MQHLYVQLLYVQATATPGDGTDLATTAHETDTLSMQ